MSVDITTVWISVSIQNSLYISGQSGMSRLLSPTYSYVPADPQQFATTSAVLKYSSSSISVLVEDLAVHTGHVLVS